MTRRVATPRRTGAVQSRARHLHQGVRPRTPLPCHGADQPGPPVRAPAPLRRSQRTSTSGRLRSMKRPRGANHPEFARVLNDLALLSAARPDPANAVAYSRKASAAVLAHATLGDTGGTATARCRRSHRAARKLLRKSCRQPRGGRPGGRRALVGARPRGVRNGAMGEPVGGRRRNPAARSAFRRQQRRACRARAPEPGPVCLLARPRQGADRGVVETGRASDGADRQHSQAIADTEKKLAAIDARLQKEFPDYAALANPKPVKVEEVQKLLGSRGGAGPDPDG